MEMVVPVILSGGDGSRLWPQSRKAYPKQLHKLYGNYTMLQHTANRVRHLASPIVVCNEDQRFMVAHQLSEVCDSKPDILLEPVGRNTAPAIVAAALYAKQKYGDAKLLVLAADHLIKDNDTFRRSIDIALEQADSDRLVTFGVVPTHPETGYGYICAENATESKGSKVIKFVEKPDRKTAEAYLQHGGYLWNSGIFVFPIKLLLDELTTQGTPWLEFCSESVNRATRDLDFVRLEQTHFAECANISIDYALMEKTNKAWVIPLDAGWSDLGSWEAVWDASTKDKDGNAAFGDAYLKDCSNSYVHSENRFVAAVGLEDVIIVESADALLVANKSRSQDVKDIVDWLKASNRTEHENHRQIHKPWGSVDLVDKGEGYQVNRIEVDSGASLSLQMHQHRAEHWVVIKGTAKVERDGQELLVAENESIYITRHVKHRLSNPGRETLVIVEVQTGRHLGEEDTIRFESD